MVDVDRSKLGDRAQVYDSFVQLISGANKLRLKSLQSSEPDFSWPNLDRISDDGKLFLTPQVSQSRYSQRIVLTTDEVSDNVDPSGDPDTISFYIKEKELRNSVQIQVSCVAFAKESTETKKTLRLNFTYELEKITQPRVNGDGDVFVDTEGRILPDTISYIRGFYLFAISLIFFCTSGCSKAFVISSIDTESFLPSFIDCII